MNVFEYMGWCDHKFKQGLCVKCCHWEDDESIYHSTEDANDMVLAINTMLLILLTPNCSTDNLPTKRPFKVALIY